MASEADERKLSAIGDAMREAEATVDPRLERLVQGKLSADELETLRKEAESDPELLASIEVFTPVSPDFQRKMVDVAMASVREPPAPVIPLRRAATVLIPLAAAAVAAFLFLRPAVNPPPAPSLPVYRLDFSVERGSLRSDAASQPAHPETEVSLILRPQTAIEEGLEAQLYVLPAGKPVSRSPVAPTQIHRGAVLWTGRVADMAPGVSGDVRLIGVVGRPGRLPTPEFATKTTEGPGWRSASVRLSIISP